MGARYVVDILGQQYPLKAEEGTEEELKAAAELVASKIQEASSATRTKDVGRLGILTALQLAGEYNKLKKDYDELMELLENK